MSAIFFFSGCFSLMNWAPEAHQESSIFRPGSVYYSEERESLAYETEITTEGPRRLIPPWSQSSTDHGYVLLSAAPLLDAGVLQRIGTDREEEEDPFRLFVEIRDNVSYNQFSRANFPERMWTVVEELPENHLLIHIFANEQGFTLYSHKMIEYPVMVKLVRVPVALTMDVISLPFQIIYLPFTMSIIAHSYRHPGESYF